jgi:hypothetical protein
MTEQQLQINAKPFVFWAIVIFAVCFLSLIVFVRSEPLASANGPLACVICAAVSVVVALGGAFLVCGVAAAFRGFRSGQLGLVDLIAPAVVLVALVLFLMGYTLIPKVTGTVELCIWSFVLVMWLADLHRRMGRRKKSSRTSESS